MRDSIEKGKTIGQNMSPNNFRTRGPLTDLEIQKVTNFYPKIGETPGPDNIQTELIKTIPPEQLNVIQLCLNEILSEDKPLTKVKV